MIGLMIGPVAIRPTVVAAQQSAPLPTGRPVGPAAESGGPARGRLEQMVRARWMVVVRNRLGLTDAQAARLVESNRHFQAQRQQLNIGERGIRAEMRAQLTGGAQADDRRMAVLLDSLLDLQRQRLEVVRAEQRELSLFLTPTQRVRYLALQEQLRQRMEELRQRTQARRTPGSADTESVAP
jgi:hypothetical protein